MGTGSDVHQSAVTMSGLQLLERKANGPRNERVHARLDGAEVELRVVKQPFAHDGVGFVSRTEALAQLSHPSLRMVRGAVVLPDGRPAAVLSAVDWIPLSASPRQPTEPLVSMALELAEGLAALHEAGLVMGVLDGDDVFPGQPAVLDASLTGLSQGGDTPQADVKMLALALLGAVGGGKEAGPLEAILKRARVGEFTAEALAKELTMLRARWQSRTNSAQQPEVEIVEPDLSGFTLSHWKLERVLGEGAMAKVYLAADTRTGVKAAVKVLKQEHVVEPEFVQRFVQEVRAVEAIENPHIVTVTDFGDQLLAPGQRLVFCVMELLEGIVLSDAMTREAFGVVRAVCITQQAARALHAAHDVGVVHRDVKPENLFLTRQGGSEFVKVLDFGVAKLLRPIGDLPKVGTKAGIVVGTPEYMAPEQAMGTGTDARVDVYALGLVLYELLCGEQPFKGDTFGKLVLEITQSAVPPLPAATPAGERLPPGLSAVVLRCLEKHPDDRFPSAAALADALEPYASPRRSLNALPVVPADAVPSATVVDEAALAAAIRPSRAPLFIALAAGLAVLAGLAVVFAGGKTEPVTPPAPVVPVAKKKADPLPVVPEAPRQVWLDVQSTPPGAQVKRGDEVLGVTPLRLSVARVETPASLSFTLANYVAETREVALTDDVVLSVDLKPQEKVAPKKLPPVKKKPPKRK